jgi:hypothetical protein
LNFQNQKNKSEKSWKSVQKGDRWSRNRKNRCTQEERGAPRDTRTAATMGLFGGRRGSSLGQPLLDDEGELLPETPNPKELDSGGGLGMGFGSVGSPGSSGTLQSPTSNYEVRGVATLSCVHVTRWGEHAPTLTHLGGHPRVLSCLFSRWCYCCDHLSHPPRLRLPKQSLNDAFFFRVPL